MANLKMLGLVTSVAGAAIGVVGTVLQKQEQEQLINKAVEKAVAKKLGETVVDAVAEELN